MWGTISKVLAGAGFALVLVSFAFGPWFGLVFTQEFEVGGVKTVDTDYIDFNLQALVHTQDYDGNVSSSRIMYTAPDFETQLGLASNDLKDLFVTLQYIALSGFLLFGVFLGAVFSAAPSQRYRKVVLVVGAIAIALCMIAPIYMAMNPPHVVQGTDVPEGLYGISSKELLDGSMSTQEWSPGWGWYLFLAGAAIGIVTLLSTLRYSKKLELDHEDSVPAPPEGQMPWSNAGIANEDEREERPVLMEFKCPLCEFTFASMISRSDPVVMCPNCGTKGPVQLPEEPTTMETPEDNRPWEEPLNDDPYTDDGYYEDDGTNGDDVIADESQYEESYQNENDEV